MRVAVRRISRWSCGRTWVEPCGYLGTAAAENQARQSARQSEIARAACGFSTVGLSAWISSAQSR